MKNTIYIPKIIHKQQKKTSLKFGKDLVKDLEERSLTSWIHTYNARIKTISLNTAITYLLPSPKPPYSSFPVQTGNKLHAENP